MAQSDAKTPDAHPNHCRRDLGGNRHEQRHRRGIEHGLQPSRPQRRGRIAEDERVETGVGGQTVEDEEIAVRARAALHQPPGREVLALVEMVHGRVGVVVEEEHQYEDNQGATPDCQFGVRWPQPPLLYAFSKAVAAATALQRDRPQMHPARAGQ